MPASILSSLFGWAASHLVVLSLLGFLFAGLVVFGAIRLPGDWAAPASAGTGPGASSTARVKEPERAAPPEAPATAPVQEMPASSGDSVVTEHDRQAERTIKRKTPKLIGGTLPVYEQPRLRAPVDAPPPAASAQEQGFRPSADVEPSEMPQTPTRSDLVQHARRAYWNGDFEGAETAYMTLIAAYPEDADGFGELGNLYQSMGKDDAARDAYYEAGVRLKAVGEQDKLNKVIDLMVREGDPRADQLRP